MLKWVIERIEGKAAAVETPIGYVPTADALDLTGLDGSRDGHRGRAARSTPRSGGPRSR